MRTTTLCVVGVTAIVLLDVGSALAEPTTGQTLVAMSLLSGEDQKPVAPPPKPPAAAKPKAPSAGTSQAPSPLPSPTAGSTAPAAPAAPSPPAKPGVIAPTAGTPAPPSAAPAAAPQAGAKPPAPVPSAAASAGPKEPPKPVATPPPAAPVPPLTTTATPGASVPQATGADGYSYDPKSRRDPFQSLTKMIKSASLNPQMPPLQRVQINDMKLLGIMWGGYGYYGLVQTPDGKGYTVKEGMLLGTNNGIIKTITDKAIIVSEPTVDIAGRKSTKEVELLLRPREVTE